MDSLALKLALTPALVGAASLAGRRWGPGVSGWLVGLPLTSGPIAFFLALEQGTGFAAGAAAGSLAGAIAQAAFCVAYGRLAHRGPWLTALLAGTLAFTAAAVVLQRLALPAAPLFAGTIAALVLALRLMPRGRAAAAAAPGPRWDIPARMAVTTAIVLLLTALAPTLGPRLSGLLATFPLFAAVLAVFAHHAHGPAPATGVLRGLLLGLFAFAAFFLVLAALLDRAALLITFTAATTAALAIQAASLHAARDRRTR